MYKYAATKPHRVVLDEDGIFKLFDEDIRRSYFCIYCQGDAVTDTIEIVLAEGSETPSAADFDEFGIELQYGVMWEPRAVPLSAIWCRRTATGRAVAYTGGDPTLVTYTP